MSAFDVVTYVAGAVIVVLFVIALFGLIIFFIAEEPWGKP